MYCTSSTSAHQQVVNVDEPHTQLVFLPWGTCISPCGQPCAGNLGEHRHAGAFHPGLPALAGRGDQRARRHRVGHRPAATATTARQPHPHCQQQRHRAGPWRAGLRSGLRVDRIVDVVDVPNSNLQPPPANVAEQLRPLVLGVLQWQGQPVTVLDVERLLGDYAQTLA